MDSVDVLNCELLRSWQKRRKKKGLKFQLVFHGSGSETFRFFVNSAQNKNDSFVLFQNYWYTECCLYISLVLFWYERSLELFLGKSCSELILTVPEVRCDIVGDAVCKKEELSSLGVPSFLEFLLNAHCSYLRNTDWACGDNCHELYRNWTDYSISETESRAAVDG